MMQLAPLDRYLLTLLDGSRDREARIEARERSAGASVGRTRERGCQNVIRIDRNDGQPLDDTDVREVLTAEVDALTQRLAHLQMLNVDGPIG